MGLIENPSGRADLLIWDNSYRRSSDITQDVERGLEYLEAFAKISNETLNLVVRHAEGLLSLLESTKVKGDPDLVAIDQAIIETDLSNDIVRRRLLTLQEERVDQNTALRLETAADYVNLMEQFIKSLHVRSAKFRLYEKAHRYEGRFLNLAKERYYVLAKGKTKTLGDELQTDCRIVALACAASYQNGFNRVVVLSRDTTHILKMINIIKGEVFLGNKGSKYGIKHAPQKDFSINVYSGSVERLFELGVVARPERIQGIH